MGEEKRECSYIMANALCPFAVSAGRWCIAWHSRANGEMKQAREESGETWDEATSHLNVKGGITKDG